MAGADLIGYVTTAEPYVVPPRGGKRFTVAAIDLGVKSMTLRQLAERGIEVHVLPATTGWEQVEALAPDGLFLSNGPGDPSTAESAAVLCRRALAAGVPLFGICMGNQVLGRALGFDTYKLKYGHRGINQPVLDRASGRIGITSHNHGFAVDAPTDHPVDTSYGRVEVSHVCLNDDVVEGLRLTRDGRLAAFSVQYHPEAAAGPHDAAYLFDEFVQMMADNTSTTKAGEQA